MSLHIPTIQADDLTLLSPCAQAQSLYEAFYTDAQASGAYGGPLTVRAARARLVADIDSWRRWGFGVWVIQRRQQQDLVGVCGFWQGPGWPRELTWWLLPGARGAGIAYRASQAAIRHAHDVFGWSQVQTYMNDTNHSALSLVLRLGGVRQGRRQFPDGVERDVFTVPRPPDM